MSQTSSHWPVLTRPPMAGFEVTTEAARPLDRQTAAEWLEKWNSHDKFAAFNMLVEPLLLC